MAVFNFLWQVSYGTSVRKIPCANHTTKNVRKHLEELRKVDKSISAAHASKISGSVRYLISLRLSAPECRSAILNTVKHTGGDHTRCKTEWSCSHNNKTDDLPWGSETVTSIQVYFTANSK